MRDCIDAGAGVDDGFGSTVFVSFVTFFRCLRFLFVFLAALFC
jgi:hypothetical protein